MTTRVGELIKDARQLTGMSLLKVSGLCQTTAQFLSMVETGRRSPSVDVARRLVEVLPIKAVEMRNAMVIDYSDEVKRRWKDDIS